MGVILGNKSKYTQGGENGRKTHRFAGFLLENHTGALHPVVLRRLQSNPLFTYAGLDPSPFLHTQVPGDWKKHAGQMDN
jgi:hypothetical protein